MQTNKALLYGVILLVGLVVLGVVQIPTTGGAGAILPGASQPAAPATCNLATTSTITSTAYDFAKPGTAVSSETKAYYLDSATGQLNPGSNTVQPGQTITVLSTKTNWFGTKNTQAIPCAPSILMTAKMKAVDTSSTLTAKNADGTTTNDISTAPQGIAASGTTTLHLKMSQGSPYKFMAGESGKTVFYFNATNVTDWAPGQFSASFDNVPCSLYGQGGLSNTATPSALGGVLVQAFVCNADFAANDGAIHDFAIKLGAGTGEVYNQTVSVRYAGVDFYQNTITSALEVGGVKDSGAAIQTLQGKDWVVN